MEPDIKDTPDNKTSDDALHINRFPNSLTPFELYGLNIGVSSVKFSKNAYFCITLKCLRGSKLISELRKTHKLEYVTAEFYGI